jgi:hypothetical protein
MLEPTTYQDAFPIVELAPSGVDLQLRAVERAITPVWTGRAAQQAYETYGCIKDDKLARVVVKMWPKSGPERFDVLAFPDLTYFAKQDRRNWNNHVGCRGERPLFRDGQLEIFDQWTQQRVATVDGTWPAGKPSSLAERRGTPGIWELRWPTAAFAVDLSTRTVTAMPAPQKASEASDPPPFAWAVADHARCSSSDRRMGNRVWVFCAGRDGSTASYLWHPTDQTIQRVDGRDTLSLRAPENEAMPWAVRYFEVPAIRDEATGTFLRLPTGPLRLYETMLGARSYLGLSEDGREIRRYDLDATTFDVVRRYDARDCAGRIGAQAAVKDQARFIVVTCVRPDAKRAPGQLLHSTLVWTELVDLEAQTVWRTRLHVHEVLSDGTAVVSDATRMDLWSYFQRVWVALPPGNRS